MIRYLPTIVFILAAFVQIACKQQLSTTVIQTEGTIEERDMSKGPVVKYDAYFTWMNYDGPNEGPPEAAIYLWNGQDVGQGETGYAEIVKKLKSMPPGSIILIYPSYVRLKEAGSGEPLRIDPFRRHYEVLYKIAQERNLLIVLSHYDHNGQLTQYGREEREYRQNLERLKK